MLLGYCCAYEASAQHDDMKFKRRDLLLIEEGAISKQLRMAGGQYLRLIDVLFDVGYSTEINRHIRERCLNKLNLKLSCGLLSCMRTKTTLADRHCLTGVMLKNKNKLGNSANYRKRKT